MRNYLIILTLLVALPICSAAKIYGNIYDFELEIAKNTVISIGPVNKQVFVSRNGNYSFNVPLGSYELIAKKKPDLIAKEKITIKEEGEYLVDLILLPDISEEEFLLEEVETEVLEKEEKTSNYIYIGIIFITLIILIIVYFILKNFILKKEKKLLEDELTNQVISIVKREGGRITQKNLRKQIPYSEAKISLVISELEKKEKIEKIKKGRENILILKE